MQPRVSFPRFRVTRKIPTIILLLILLPSQMEAVEVEERFRKKATIAGMEQWWSHDTRAGYKL